VFLDANAGALDHEEILVDHAVMREAAHGRDALFGEIILGGGVLGVGTAAHAIDHLRTVMISVLTGTWDRVHDARRMPGADAGDLAQAFVGLARKLLGAPSMGDTLKALALADTDNIDHFVRLKDRGDMDGLFQVRSNPVDLVLDEASVQLDFHDMRLLLAQTGDLAHLGMSNDPYHLVVSLDAFQLALH